MRHILFLTGILFLTACSKSGINTWEAKPRAWFTRANDTTLFSFYSQPADINEYTIELPVSVAGIITETEREFTIRDLGGSKYNPGSIYEIVSAKLPERQGAGTVRIRIQKTDNLNRANDTLTFEICASQAFELGLTQEYWKTSVIISNILSKPSWWNGMAERYIGYYSDKKMEIIYTVNGAYELFSSKNNHWNADETAVMIYKLNRYCIDNQIKYNPEDKSVIVFDFRSN